ncbi:MAG: DUF3179 domain-containing protein [Gemmatimonadota bacterium]|nr:DUF3179 domain-containing protein [Gemmatimonadota bacterium]
MRTAAVAAVAGTLALAACGTSDPAGPAANCAIPLDRFFDAGSERTTIPYLTNPELARRGTPDIAYLILSDRVIGFMFNGQPVAIPHKFLWHHELVNMEIPGQQITVTYSPLTGSSAVYDRTGTGIGPMSISKYVLNSGLVIEEDGGSLRPQMSTIATCGAADGTSLSQIPFDEMTLGSWINLHLDTWVASSATNLGILYTLFPYPGDYRDLNSTRLIYPLDGGIDPRHPPKDLVFGVRSGTGGMAFSLFQLDQLRGAINVFVSVANAEIDGRPVAVFWNAAARGARAYDAEVNGQRLHFDLVNGQRVDVETGSSWDFSGEAFNGPLTGSRLEPITDTVVAYWFAWAAYQPDTDLWSPPIAASLLPAEDVGLPEGEIDWELSTR